MVACTIIIILATLATIASWIAWKYFVLWVAVSGLIIEKYHLDIFQEAYSKENIDQQVQFYFETKKQRKRRVDIEKPILFYRAFRGWERCYCGWAFTKIWL